jgi:glycerate kinase
MAMMVATMAESHRSRGRGKPTPVLLAPDSFKGTFSAPEVAVVLASPLERSGHEVDRCPLADGGEGTAEALRGAVGGDRVEAEAHDPLGRPIDSSFVVLSDGSAVVDTAAASGLGLLAADERDPVTASTFGTGELIVAAARRAPRVLVGIGGSATTDGGFGLLHALLANGRELSKTDIDVACDVSNPLLGPTGAAATYGPQKGASPDDVARLDARNAEASVSRCWRSRTVFTRSLFDPASS